MNVRASQLICCVYLQLDTRVRGRDMTHHNLTPQQPWKYELPHGVHAVLITSPVNGHENPATERSSLAIRGQCSGASSGLH